MDECNIEAYVCGRISSLYDINLISCLVTLHKEKDSIDIKEPDSNPAHILSLLPSIMKESKIVVIKYQSLFFDNPLIQLIAPLIVSTVLINGIRDFL